MAMGMDQRTLWMAAAVPLKTAEVLEHDEERCQRAQPTGLLSGRRGGQPTLTPPWLDD